MTSQIQSNQEEFQRYCNCILAHLRTSPGLSETRIVRILGFNDTEYYRGRIKEVLTSLEAQKLIAIEPPNKVYNYRRLFLYNDRPKKVTIVNFEARTNQPPDSGTEQPQQKTDKLTHEPKIIEIKRKLEEALDFLIAMNQPFTIKDWRDKAGIKENAFYAYQEYYETLKLKAHQTIAECKRNAQQRSIQTRNQEPPQQSSEPMPHTITVFPIEWLRQQRNDWQKKEGELKQELEHLEADLRSVQANRESCERLLSLYEHEPPYSQPIDKFLGGLEG